jgi:hypothetical protein
MQRSALAFTLALGLAACAPSPATGQPAKDYSACPGAKPAMDVMQSFIAAFNAKDMAALEKTFHFPHMRIAAYPLHVLTGPGQQDDVFGNLAAEGWAKSRWDDLAIVQCGPEKAHIVATFARLRADGAEYARYDGLYIVENRDGFWGITARSTFAP